MATDPSSSWLNVEQAASRIGCSPKLVYKLCEARKLGHSRIGFGRGKIVISPDQIAEYQRRCEVVPAEGEPAGPEPRRKRRDVAIPDTLAKYQARKRKTVKTSPPRHPA